MLNYHLKTTWIYPCGMYWAKQHLWCCHTDFHVIGFSVCQVKKNIKNIHIIDRCIVNKFHTICTYGIHIYTHAHSYTLSHIHVHACMHTYTHLHIHTHIQMHTRAYTCIYTHLCTHAHTCTYARIHTYTHTHTDWI